MEFVMGIGMWVIGVVIGVSINSIRNRKHKSDGILLINKQDPDFATCGIKFNKDVAAISKQSSINLKVIVEDSRK